MNENEINNPDYLLERPRCFSDFLTFLKKYVIRDIDVITKEGKEFPYFLMIKSPHGNEFLFSVIPNNDKCVYLGITDLNDDFSCRIHIKNMILTVK